MKQIIQKQFWPNIVQLERHIRLLIVVFSLWNQLKDDIIADVAFIFKFILKSDC